jgi:dUTP pyrophosphatase
MSAISEIKIHLQQLPHAAGLPLPAYQTAGAAGMDLVAANADYAKIIIEPGARALVPTGIALHLPVNCEAQVRPRSGLALKHGVTVLNSPGTIDADYRGEVQVLLVNLGDAPFEITRGMRIAQLVVATVGKATLVQVDQLDASDRAGGGFGSTGTSS